VKAHLKFAILLFTVLGCSLAQAQHSEIPLDQVEIRLERSACFGFCPVYSVTVHGDGTVEFDGKQYTAHRGVATWRIDPGDVVTLVNQLLDAHFFEAAPSYVSREVAEIGPEGGLLLFDNQVTDLPGATLTFKLGEREHSVFLYYNVPAQLETLPDAVDEIAQTEQYVSGGGG